VDGARRAMGEERSLLRRPKGSWPRGRGAEAATGRELGTGRAATDARKKKSWGRGSNSLCPVFGTSRRSRGEGGPEERFGWRQGDGPDRGARGTRARNTRGDRVNNVGFAVGGGSSLAAGSLRRPRESAYGRSDRRRPEPHRGGNKGWRRAFPPTHRTFMERGRVFGRGAGGAGGARAVRSEHP